MSLIEQAAQRLAQLRKAGIDMPTAAETTVSAADLEPVLPPESSDDPLHVAKPPELVIVHAQEMAMSRSVELDIETLEAAEIITPDALRSQLADEYRVIKRPLIDNAMGKGAARIKYGNLIMVTSALPGEGKTYTAANLAMSIAMELNNTVMLVDADVARPTLMKKLGLSATHGLLDVLVDESIDLSQVLLRTNIEKLTILPSGTAHPRATELLASDAMVGLLEELANRYPDRIIIFDSPPLLVTTEARILASHMGQVVLVVQAECTSHADVKNALATIDACPVKLMLLNQAQASLQGRYGSGYGYGYGYGNHNGS